MSFQADKSDGDGHCDLVELLVKLARHVESLGDVEVGDLAVAHDYDAVAEALIEQIDRSVTHLAGDLNTVG